MKILYLHGWKSGPGSTKASWLASHGHEVCDPLLSADDFALALQAAQGSFAAFAPDLIVGSSRGGAVAINLDAGAVPRVLLCPAWKHWGEASTVPPGTVILHSRMDETVPFANSVELLAQSGLGEGSLVETGSDHRLSDSDSLQRLLEACLRSVKACQ